MGRILGTSNKGCVVPIDLGVTVAERYPGRVGIGADTAQPLHTRHLLPVPINDKSVDMGPEQIWCIHTKRHLWIDALGYCLGLDGVLLLAVDAKPDV